MSVLACVWGLNQRRRWTWAPFGAPLFEFVFISPKTARLSVASFSFRPLLHVIIAISPKGKREQAGQGRARQGEAWPYPSQPIGKLLIGASKLRLYPPTGASRVENNPRHIRMQVGWKAPTSETPHHLEPRGHKILAVIQMAGGGCPYGLFQ